MKFKSFLKFSENFAKTFNLNINFRPFLQSEFCVVFRIFVCVKRSTFILKLSRISRLKIVTKFFDDFVIIHQNL